MGNGKITNDAVALQAIGQGSLCWDPKPTGVFDTEQATKAAKPIIDALNAKDKEIALANMATRDYKQTISDMSKEIEKLKREKPNA